MSIEIEGKVIDMDDLDNEDSQPPQSNLPQSMSGERNISQPTEVGEVMRTMFPEENMNNTKMLGNINPTEETYILAFLILNKLKVTPTTSRDIVLEKLLLSVSRNARGRDDGRDIMVGKREQDIKLGGMGRMGEGIKSFFGMGGQR